MNEELNPADPGIKTGDEPGGDDVEGGLAADADLGGDFRGHETQEGLLKGYDDLKASQTGAPESLDEYVFTVADGVDVEISDTVVSEFKDLAKDINLTPEQYDKIVGFDIAKAQAFNDGAPDREKAADAAALEDSKVKADEVIAELKTELGAGFDEAVGFQQKAFSDFGITELKDDPVFANNKLAFKFAAAVGKALSEKKINSGDSQITNQNPKGESGEDILVSKDVDKL
jgi:hypothetical protein